MSDIAIVSPFASHIGDAGWDEARSSMVRLEAASDRVSRAWLGGAVALAFSVLFLGFTAVLATITLGRLHDSFGWVLHTQAAVLEVSLVEEGLFESSAAERSFVITADANYIAIYRQARVKLDRHVAALAGVVADDPVQLQRAYELRRLITGREAWFDRSGGLTPSRREKMAAEIRSKNSGKSFLQLTLAARMLIESLRATETRLLAERQQRAVVNEANLLWLSGTAGVMALVCGVFGMLLIQRERGEYRARELQLELMHTQRLAMVNQSSAMLAHELNQPLTAATNYIGALKRLAANESADSRAKAVACIENIRLQIERTGRIVARLRSFVDKRVAERTREQPSSLVEDAVSLLGTIDISTTLRVEVEPGLPPVMIDRVQVQQVLVNLMRNAIEAMQDSPSRDLTLRVVAAGRCKVQFSLQDSGPGLSKSVTDRLFKPFVTSKKDGLGVGLSICRTIIDAHGGKIWAESSGGAGTVFHFTLPAAQALAAA